MTPKRENPVKRGPKPYFTGSRQKLLEEHLEEYASLKHKNRNQFWFEFFAKWWEKFPWKLDDKDEPPLDDPAEMDKLGSVGAGERGRKSEVEVAVTLRIKNWFAYQSQNRPTAVNHNDNAGWFRLVQRLHESIQPKPRKRSAVHQFMAEEPSLVDTEFTIKYGDGRGIDGTERLNKRFDIAKRLLNDRYQDRILDLEARARETHEKEIQQWSLTLSNIELASDVDAARDSLFSITHSLLKVIGSYTGCYVTLVAAAVPSKSGNQDYFSAVHYVPDGKVSRKNWTEWDADGFRIGVARPFKRYIKSMETVADSNVPPPKDPLLNVATPTADVDVAPLLITTSTRPHSRPAPSPTLSGAAALKRTATGKYKKRPVIYTEGGDSDECSAGELLDCEETSQKRPRVDVTITRSRSNSSHSPPPDVPTLPQSPVPSGQRIVDPLNDGVLNPPDPQTNDRSTPSTDRTSVLPVIETPSTSACTTRRATSTMSRTEPTTPPERHGLPSPALPTVNINTRSNTTNDTIDTVTPLGDAASLETNLRAAAITAIPQFLNITQKKNKASIYSYLVSCEDPHFQSLLRAYVAFENAATTSERPGSLSTIKRPSQISCWIRCARVNTAPSWSNICDYGSSVVTWWSSLQPSWRKLECGTSSREEGSLECLSQPGINGLLNLVILAYWWSNGLTESGADSKIEGLRYRWFVADVTWVLSELLETAQFS